VDKTNVYSRSATSAPAAGIQSGHNDVKPERLGSGDIDALMARLVVEDNRNRKPVLTKHGIYKAIGALAVIVVLFVFIL
jgi:hypothetical protein